MLCREREDETGKTAYEVGHYRLRTGASSRWHRFQFCPTNGYTHAKFQTSPSFKFCSGIREGIFTSYLNSFLYFTHSFTQSEPNLDGQQLPDIENCQECLAPHGAPVRTTASVHSVTNKLGVQFGTSNKNPAEPLGSRSVKKRPRNATSSYISEV